MYSPFGSACKGAGHTSMVRRMQRRLRVGQFWHAVTTLSETENGRGAKSLASNGTCRALWHSAKMVSNELFYKLLLANYKMTKYTIFKPLFCRLSGIGEVRRTCKYRSRAMIFFTGLHCNAVFKYFCILNKQYNRNPHKLVPKKLKFLIADAEKKMHTSGIEPESSGSSIIPVQRCTNWAMHPLFSDISFCTIWTIYER